VSEPHVFDASALIALSLGETGAETARPHMEVSFVSAVNLAEVVAKLEEKGLSSEDVGPLLIGFGLSVIEFDEQQAFEAGRLRKALRSTGLSLGDRACIALANRLGAPILTSDREFLRYKGPIEIRLIR
jgi:ribonuclease VapC